MHSSTKTNSFLTLIKMQLNFSENIYHFSDDDTFKPFSLSPWLSLQIPPVSDKFLGLWQKLPPTWHSEYVLILFLKFDKFSTDINDEIPLFTVSFALKYVVYS